MREDHPRFRTEAELCAAFISTVGTGWTAYPETGGWDILLVRKEDGCQIGIEAKLRLNAKVMVQAAESSTWAWTDGPDYRAALVPFGKTGDLGELAPYCRITILRFSLARGFRPFDPELPTIKEMYYMNDRWFEMMPLRRCVLPEYVPDVVAGVPSPTRLTQWKIRALKIAVLLDRTGYVTRADFKRLQIDIRRWLGEGWLQPSPQGFIAVGELCSRFRLQHPQVWEQIAADPQKWRRPELPLSISETER